MHTKKCSSCGLEKPLGEFYRSNTVKGGLQNNCKPCCLQLQWESKLKRVYGIDKDIYNKMFVEQDGCCAICRRHQLEFPKRHAVDHCHTTGKVRGLLCEDCNTSLGKFNDDIQTLERAIKYLRAASEG